MNVSLRGWENPRPLTDKRIGRGCIGVRGTYVREMDGMTVVRYHDTDVVKFDEDVIVLNTGGWWTMTTVKRMNQTAQRFNLDFAVDRSSGEWTVRHNPDGPCHAPGTIVHGFDNDVLVIDRHEYMEDK